MSPSTIWAHNVRRNLRVRVVRSHSRSFYSIC